jgi:ribosomal-protein-alanine N-acetyltransferase
MAPPEIITAPLVVLRRVRPTDGQAIFRVVSNSEVMRYMDWPMPTDPSSTEAHLQRAVADWNSGAEYQWVIVERSTAAVIGSIGYRTSGHAADFGYFLGRDYWGKGLARDAASSLVSWLAAQPQIHRIWASVDAENLRSRRLLERVGLQLESVLRMTTVRPNIGGPPRDTAIYALANVPPDDGSERPGNSIAAGT